MAGPWAGAVTCGESPGWVGYREGGLVPEALGAERWALEVQELGGASNRVMASSQWWLQNIYIRQKLS